VANFNINFPWIEIADYKPQRLPQFKGNPLIEALPYAKSSEEYFEAMTQLPDFVPDQRTWSNADRIQMVLTLSKCLIPSMRHVKLATSLDSMLRSCYEGRAPRTPEHAKRLQKLCESKGLSRPSPMQTLESNPELSTLLMGIPGMGKTSSVKRFSSHFPEVIYHPELNVYQVPFLHVEMPSDGASTKALAFGILRKLDKLIPGANYFKEFAKIRENGDILMLHVAHLMDVHFVGFLIADEIQNLTNAHSGKSKQTVMTELVSSCNNLSIPLLFIGTNKAAEVFSLDFRTSRRGTGHCIEQWNRLTDEVEDVDTSDTEEGRAVSEWHEFLDVLWSFQWVRNPVELDAHFSTTMYHLCQGVIDIAIKLFASAQVNAMFNKTERLTPELLVRVYETELTLLHPMLDALREGKPQNLARFPDIAPVGIKDYLDMAARKVKSKASDEYVVKPSDPTFVPSIAASLVAGGVDETRALEVAEQVFMEGKAKNLHEGVDEARKLLKPKSTGRRKASKGSGTEVKTSDEADYAAEDYRRAIARAEKEGTRIFEQLQKLGFAKPLGQLLDVT